jgi:hypothetical protein
MRKQVRLRQQFEIFCHDERATLFYFNHLCKTDFRLYAFKGDLVSEPQMLQKYKIIKYSLMKYCKTRDQGSCVKV